MITRFLSSLVSLSIPLVAVAAYGQPPVAQTLKLESYEVWCTDAAIPDGADETRYYQSLADGVGVIDKALGTNASTGTPFAARSRRREEAVTDKGPATSSSVVTVCARVSSPGDPPAGGKVYRETRNEVVFAQACPIADRDNCIDRLRTLLAQQLKASPGDDRIQHLFWRAASSVEQPVGAKGLVETLLLHDRRRVSATPQVAISGDSVAASELSKPIEQQTARPLIQARPSWFSILAQPQDGWLVVAITLTDEMIQEIASGSPTGPPASQPDPPSPAAPPVPPGIGGVS